MHTDRPVLVLTAYLVSNHECMHSMRDSCLCGYGQNGLCCGWARGLCTWWAYENQYTLFHTTRALAAGAMCQNWKVDARRHGLPGFLWVFPPFPLIGMVITRLLVERVNAVLMVPRFMRFWVAML